MEKILIVDDSAVQAAQLKGILTDEYDVSVAQTAEDGLRRASSESYSLILLDVVMPGMDGFTPKTSLSSSSPAFPMWKTSSTGWCWGRLTILQSPSTLRL